MSVAKRKCQGCKKSFPPNGFHSGQSVCKSCNHERVKEWRKKNPTKAKEQYRRNKKRRRERDAIRKAEDRLPVIVERES